MNQLPALSILTAVPLTAGLLILAMPAGWNRLARWPALLAALIALAAALTVAAKFDPASGVMQFCETRPWIASLGVEYKLGVDGLGLLLVLLSAVITPMALIASWQVSDRARLFFGLMLLLEAGLFGTFTALNFFHWFLFWELSLIPAFFLVRLWGGPRRAEAATQFFVYTMVGSVALLLAFLALYLCAGTFDFQTLSDLGRKGALTGAISEKLGWRDLTTRNVTLVIFGAAFLGFAVKVPLWPFHTWLPITYAEAPPGVTMMLTGLMSKMGVYGFIRILLPIFPIQMHWVTTPLLALAVVSIIASAAVAWAQTDLKRMLAYSSINHLGYCMLGVFALATAPLPQVAEVEKVTALNGVLLQIFNHGLTASALFWFAGILEQRNGGRRGIGDFGGIRQSAPVLCGLMGIALFSSLGLPGLNGFVGELLIFKGVFALSKFAAALAIPGLLLTAIFILGFVQKAFWGPSRAPFADLRPGEIALLSVPVLLMFLLGVYPQALIRLFNVTVMNMVEGLGF